MCPRPAFSSKFRLYGDWFKAADKSSKYVQKIIELHKFFPDRNLKFLRSQKLSEVSFADIPFSKLSATQKEERLQSLHAMEIYKKEKKRDGSSITLRDALKKTNEAEYTKKINEKILKKHLGKYFKKKGRRMILSKNNKIQTKMDIISQGKVKRITVIEKERIVIRQYKKDLYEFRRGWLHAKKFEEMYKNKYVTDIHGKKYRLECDYKKIKDALAAETEDFTIFASSQG